MTTSFHRILDKRRRRSREELKAILLKIIGDDELLNSYAVRIIAVPDGVRQVQIPEHYTSTRNALRAQLRARVNELP